MKVKQNQVEILLTKITDITGNHLTIKQALDLEQLVQSILVKNELKRFEQRPEELLERGPFRLNITSPEVKKNGKVINLTPREFDLFHYFMVNPGQILSRRLIEQAVWPEAEFVTDRVVDVYAGVLRKKIGNYIEGVRGFGYRFKPEGGVKYGKRTR